MNKVFVLLGWVKSFAVFLARAYLRHMYHMTETVKAVEVISW